MAAAPASASSSAIAAPRRARGRRRAAAGSSPGLRLAVEEGEPVAAGLRRLEQLPVVVEVERAGLHPRSPRTGAAPPPPRARAPARSSGRSRSRSRGGRRRGAPAGSSRPPAGRRRPGRPRERCRTRSSPLDLRDLADRQRPRLGGEEADRRRARVARHDELVGHLLAERLPERDLDEVDAERVEGEVGHLPARDARRDLDDERLAVARRSAAGTRSRPAARACAPRAARHARASSNASPKSFDGYEWIQPTPKPSPGGRSRSERSRGYGSPPRATTRPFSSRPVGELLDDRLAGRRLGERRVQVAVEVVERLEQEEAALAAGVGRLEHRREADGLRGRAPLRAAPAPPRTAAAARRPRRASAASRPCASSGAPSPCRSPAGRAPRRPRRRPAPRGRPNRQRAVDREPARDLDHALDVDEVDDLGLVGVPEPGARRGCGRPRRRAVRAASRAGSRAAGGAPRRRRGRSSLAGDATHGPGTRQHASRLDSPGEWRSAASGS